MCLLSSAIRAQTLLGTISVSGEAQVIVTPNKAVITATIESQAAEVPEVQKKNNETTQTILKFLEEQKLEERQIQTAFIEITSTEESNRVYSEKGQNNQQPAQFNRPQRQSGNPFGGDEQSSANEQTKTTTYQATRTIAITVLDLERFEEIYCGLLTRGIKRSPTVLLQNSDSKRHLEKVRQEAVQDARDKAQLMAGQLNAQLSAIRSMSESQTGLGRSGSMHSRDPFDGGSSNETTGAGKITYAAQVEIVFQLSDAVLRK